MKGVFYNQRDGGQRKALCPGVPQGPALSGKDFVLFFLGISDLSILLSLPSYILESACQYLPIKAFWDLYWNCILNLWIKPGGRDEEWSFNHHFLTKTTNKTQTFPSY